MKNLLFITTLLIGLSACNTASDEDYGNIAKDLCECVNQSTAGFSSETITVMVDAAKNNENIMEVITAHFTENPSLAMSDGMIMQKAAEEMQNKCIPEIQEKYSDVYSTSEKDSQDKLLEALTKPDGCGLTHAIMMLGVQMQ